MIVAAALCPAPPLLARELTGADPVVPELRQACRDAAAGLLRGHPDVIVVVGAGEQTATWDGSLGLDVSRFAPGLSATTRVAALAHAGSAPAAGPAAADSGPARAVPGSVPGVGAAIPFGGTARAVPGSVPGVGAVGQDGSPVLPLPLGLGARLLDQAGYDGPRVLQLVAEDEPAGRCAELGARIARSAGRVALLAMADGSARRGPKAPGYLDARCGPFDAEVERAVRDGDLDALLALDEDLARELMATGRPAWQVLAGALRGTEPASEVSYRDDPFGVAYLVALLRVRHPAR